jgi:hypothetical protein
MIRLAVRAVVFLLVVAPIAVAVTSARKLFRFRRMEVC